MHLRRYQSDMLDITRIFLRRMKKSLDFREKFYYIFTPDIHETRNLNVAM